VGVRVGELCGSLAASRRIRERSQKTAYSDCVAADAAAVTAVTATAAVAVRSRPF
jgi:hypothetical protein